MSDASKIKNLILQEMREIYYGDRTNILDWMGFPIDDENVPSYHHINRSMDLKSMGEEYYATVENGAYLGKKSHEILHTLEHIDTEMYNAWQSLFRTINHMRTYPSPEIWELISLYHDVTLNMINEKSNKKQR